MTMNKQTMKRAVVIAIAGAAAFGSVTPSWAGPALSSTTGLKEAAPAVVSDVRYYRGARGHYGNNGAGVALGVLGVAGAVAGATASRHGYSGAPGYYQQQGSYQQPGYYQQGYYGGRGPANYGYGSDY
jgi:hypothetical protein